MALFRRNRVPEPLTPTLVKPAEALAHWPQGASETIYEAKSGAAAALSCRAYELANQSRDDIIEFNGSLDDIQSLKEGLDSLYAIAQKLDEVDATLISASADKLTPVIDSFRVIKDTYIYSEEPWPLVTPEEWPQGLAAQDGEIRRWIKSAVKGAGKLAWFENMLELRQELAANLVAAYGHMYELRQDVAFFETARTTQELLPEFALADTKDELVTVAGAARKARALADSSAALDAPTLSSLDTASELPAASPDSEELSVAH